MKYVGACPSCSASIDFGGHPPPAGACGHCGQRFLVLVPEPAGAAEGELAVTLVPAGEEPLPAAVRVSGRLLLLGLAASLFLLAGLLVLGLVITRDDPLGPSPVVVAVVLGLALASAIGGGLIVGSLFGRRGASGR